MSEPVPLPWFGTVEGFALVPPEGALLASEDPVAVVVLTEGGQLMVHDLTTFTPVPLNLPFQVCPPVLDTHIIARQCPTHARVRDYGDASSSVCTRTIAAEHTTEHAS